VITRAIVVVVEVVVFVGEKKKALEDGRRRFKPFNAKTPSHIETLMPRIQLITLFITYRKGSRGHEPVLTMSLSRAWDIFKRTLGCSCRITSD